MRKLTVNDLFQYLIEAAGEPESGTTPEESLDVPFADLGYDSLALIGTTARVEQQAGIKIDDEQLGDAGTPRELLELLNRAAE